MATTLVRIEFRLEDLVLDSRALWALCRSDSILTELVFFFYQGLLRLLSEWLQIELTSQGHPPKLEWGCLQSQQRLPVVSGLSSAAQLSILLEDVLGPQGEISRQILDLTM